MRERNVSQAIRCSLENFGQFDYTDDKVDGAIRHVQIFPLYAIRAVDSWLIELNQRPYRSNRQQAEGNDQLDLFRFLVLVFIIGIITQQERSNDSRHDRHNPPSRYLNESTSQDKTNDCPPNLGIKYQP